MSGLSGDVFRAPKRDRYGDPVDDDGNPVGILDKFGMAYVGKLEDIILGAQSASPTMSRQETSDTTGMIGCRKDLSPKLKQGDRIVIQDTAYEVASKPEWDFDHSFSGSSFFNRYWVDVRARNG